MEDMILEYSQNRDYSYRCHHHYHYHYNCYGIEDHLTKGHLLITAILDYQQLRRLSIVAARFDRLGQQG